MLKFTEVPTKVLQSVRITVDRKPVEKDIPCNRYYTISESEKKITVFTKHFSKIQFMNCDKHQGNFNSFVKARICKRENSSPNLLELKVFLTTGNIQNFSIDDAQYIETQQYKLNIPEKVEESTQIHIIVKDICEGFKLLSNTGEQDTSISNSLPCYIRHKDFLPEAATLQFERKEQNNPSYLQFTLKTIIDEKSTEINISCIYPQVTPQQLNNGLNCQKKTFCERLKQFLSRLFGSEKKSDVETNSINQRQTSDGCNTNQTRKVVHLEDRHILGISERITLPQTLRHLGVILGLECHVVDVIYTNCKENVTESAYHVLQKWRLTTQDACDACKLLWKALHKAGCAHIACQVLSG